MMNNEEEREESARVALMIEEEEDLRGRRCPRETERGCQSGEQQLRRVVCRDVLSARSNRTGLVCVAISSLKRHLDDGAQAAGRASDALRFVPRAKATGEEQGGQSLQNQNYGDQDAAEGGDSRRVASTCRLSNGKLGQTVRVFCRRAAAESEIERIGGRTKRTREKGGPVGMMQGRCRPRVGTSRRRSIAWIGSVLRSGRLPVS